MTHLGLTPLDFYYVFPSYRVEPAPINELIHKLTLAVNRPIGIKVCLFYNTRLMLKKHIDCFGEEKSFEI